MINEFEDKKPLVPHEHIESVPNENIIPQLPKEDEEQDLDDLIHNSVRDEISETEEIDADEAVHNSPNNSDLQPGDEKDPDDLVHGN